MDASKPFLTSGDMSRELGVSSIDVRHILESRRIEHFSRAGTTRLFAPEKLDEVRRALASIKRRRKLAVAVVTTT